MLVEGCRTLADMVNREVENRDPERAKFSPDMVLRALDLASQELWNRQTQSVADHLLDSVDVIVADARTAGQMTPIGQEVQGLIEWRVPEGIGFIRRIEDTSRNNTPSKITFTPLSGKDWNRAPTSLGRGVPYWLWSKWSNVRGTIGFLQCGSMSTFRVWYIRRPAPLHYGTAKTGTDATVEIASTVTRIWLDRGTGGAGEIRNVDDVYRGSLIKFGTLANNAVIGLTDEIRVLTSGAATPIPDLAVGAFLWTFDQVIAFPCAGTLYEMVPQTYPEHYELLTLMAAKVLLRHGQSLKQIQLINGDIGPKLEDFDVMVARRQHQEVSTLSDVPRGY